MILSVHMLVGAAIGSRINNYWAIFFGSVLAHFLLDLLPHWEYLSASQMSDNSVLGLWLITLKALADMTIGFFIILALLRRQPQLKPALWGAFFALLPDGLIFLHILLQGLWQWTPPILEFFYSLHDILHFKERDGILFWKIAWEGLCFLLAFFTIYLSVNKEKRSPPLKRATKYLK